MTPPDHLDQQRAAHLLKLRDSSDGIRRLAIERKLNSLPKHVVTKARASHKAVAPQREVIEMPAEHVLSLGKGTSPANYIDRQVDSIKESVHMYWGRYRDGLDNFQASMTFSSEQEAESHYLVTALKAVVKVDFDFFLEGLADEAPEVAEAVKMVKEVITAELEEKERVEKAEGEIKINDYIQHIRAQIGGLEASDVEKLDALRQSVKAEYQKVADDSAGQDGVVDGPGAVLLENFERGVKQLKAQVNSRSAGKFEEEFAEAFAKSGPAHVGLVSHGWYENATLYLECSAHLKDGKWSLTGADDSWTMRTNAPKPERVVDAFKKGLKEQGKTVLESPLKKIVKVTLDIDSGSFLSADNYDDYNIEFTDIGQVSFSSADAVLHGDDIGQGRAAWDAVIKPKVLSVHEVKGKGED